MMRPSVWKPPPTMEEIVPDALLVGAVAAEAGLAERPTKMAIPAAAVTARAAIRVRTANSLLPGMLQMSVSRVGCRSVAPPGAVSGIRRGQRCRLEAAVG